MESRGLIELRLPDGGSVTREYEQFTRAQLHRGDEFEHDGTRWVMRDREDRDGVTVYLFTPADAQDEPVFQKPRARSHRGARS